jgi:nicotinamide phosphoribosyltransferase
MTRKLPLLEDNVIWLLDSYKQLHPIMYPEGTEVVVSYGSAREGSEYDSLVWFGLQAIMIKHLEGVVVTKEKIDQAEPYLHEHFKFNGLGVWTRDKWDYIIEAHGGRLPIEIRALPEGTKVGKGNLLFSIKNTDKNCWWLTNALETVIQQVWYPTAVCTRSNRIVSTIRRYFQETVDDDTQWLVDFMLHDFGQRACTCMEQAGIGGMAHLVNSKGTDTDMSIPYAVNYYAAKREGLCYSVPADEHSIATSLGVIGEYKIAQKLCEIFPKGILSKVSDSFSIEKAVEEYCHGLTRDFILKRDGKFVIRPDSPRWKGDTAAAQVLWIVQQIEKGFGATINTKGFKVLHPKVGVIYGDGLSEQDIYDVLETLKTNGYAASSCVYGQGGGLLQKLNRDTLDFSIKCLAQVRDGELYEIYKSPQGGTKKSLKGLQKPVWDYVNDKEKRIVTVPISDVRKDLTEVVFQNGSLLNEIDFDTVRANALQDNTKMK